MKSIVEMEKLEEGWKRIPPKAACERHFTHEFVINNTGKPSEPCQVSA